MPPDGTSERDPRRPPALRNWGTAATACGSAQAYFVNGDTGLKQTTELAWAGVTLSAEELAAIVPVPEAVVDDSEIDLWAEVQDGLIEAAGVALDAAAFVGTGKPASWPGARRARRHRRREHRGRRDRAA